MVRIELAYANIQGIGTQNGYIKLNYIREEVLETKVELVLGKHLHNCELGCQNCVSDAKITIELYKVLRAVRK